MGDETNPDQPPDPAAQATKLIEEGSGKKPLRSDELDHAKTVGGMSAPAKLELYHKRLNDQLSSERDRLLKENQRLQAEYGSLRVSDKELHALRKSLARDRWEFAVAVIAMAFGGSLISSFPSGTKDGVWGFAPAMLLALGWALILLVSAWQLGKLLVTTIQDGLSSRPTNPDDQ